MVTLADGLSDMSKELGETTTNTSVRRVQHYGDAIIEFFNARKWPFAIKKDNTSLSTLANTVIYAIPAGILADMRQPGGIKEIYIGSETTPYLGIDFELRNDSAYTDGKYFYIDPETTTITFLKTLGAAGQAMTIHYYFIPARATDTTTGTYPLPDRYRKIVATLAAAFVQWGRYLEGQGNRLYNVYTRMLDGVTDQQTEPGTSQPKVLQHPLTYKGFRRIYRR